MRHAITWGGLLLYAAVMLGPAAPAAAVDVQGTWDGKITCTAYTNGSKPQKSSSATTTVEITQTGQQLAIKIVSGPPGSDLVALVSDDGVHTNKGVIGGGSCPAGGPFIAIGVFGKVTIANTGDGGSLVLDIAGGAVTDVDTVFKCHVTAKRTSAVDPGLTPCP